MCNNANNLDHRADPIAPPTTESVIAQEMLIRLDRLFENMQNAKIEQISVEKRSRPAGGLPVIGHLTEQKCVCVAASHSGITLGPLLGRLVAEELLTGQRSFLLAGYSPCRLVNQPVQNFTPGNFQASYSRLVIAVQPKPRANRYDTSIDNLLSI